MDFLFLILLCFMIYAVVVVFRKERALYDLRLSYMEKRVKLMDMQLVEMSEFEDLERLLPCPCVKCENYDTNQNGCLCMVGYPMFTEDGNCEAFELE